LRVGLTDFSGLKVWLGGGSSRFTPRFEEYLRQDREFAVQTLTDMGIPKESITIKWTPEKYLSSGMRLNCGDGSCEYFYGEKP